MLIHIVADDRIFCAARNVDSAFDVRGEVVACHVHAGGLHDLHAILIVRYAVPSHSVVLARVDEYADFVSAHAAVFDCVVVCICYFDTAAGTDERGDDTAVDC